MVAARQVRRRRSFCGDEPGGRATPARLRKQNWRSHDLVKGQGAIHPDSMACTCLLNPVTLMDRCFSARERHGKAELSPSKEATGVSKKIASA